MSYWVDIHCDTPVHLAPRNPDKRCDRETFIIPGAHHKNQRTALKASGAVAHERGYHYDKLYGWQCRNCLKGRSYK